jgi:hypothetical protein
VFGKGQKERVLPVRGRLVLMAEEHLLTDLPEFTAIVNGERERVRRTPEPTTICCTPSGGKPGRFTRPARTNGCPGRRFTVGGTSICSGLAS